MPERGAALERQKVHGDGPAVAFVSQGAVEGDHDVVEEDLAELLHPVHRSKGLDGDAGRIHVDEQRGDAAMGGVGRACSREEHAPLRVLGEARPDLLPAYAPSVVGLRGPAGQRGEVATGAGFGESLAPGLVAPQKARHHGRGQVGRREGDHRRRQHLGHRIDAGLHQIALGQGLAEVGTEQGRSAQAAHLFGPAVAHPPGVEESSLDGGQLRHLFVEGGGASALGPQLGLVLIQPRIEGAAERFEVHLGQSLTGERRPCGG